MPPPQQLQHQHQHLRSTISIDRHPPFNDSSSPHRILKSLLCRCCLCARRHRCRCRCPVPVNFKHRACSLSHSLSFLSSCDRSHQSASRPPTATRSSSNNPSFISRICISDTNYFQRDVHSDIPPYPAVQTFGIL